MNLAMSSARVTVESIGGPRQCAGVALSPHDN
jgi:hypothetical protein